METPLVSICSITYNHAPFIRQCLDGFLMQQCNFPIEIIINDDCSTDGTTEIIREYAEKYPDKIFPIFHEENLYSQGVRGMFQKFVFPKARGKYIALCEGDDYWTDPLKLQKQVDFLESHPECSLCCHDVDFITCPGHEYDLYGGKVYAEGWYDMGDVYMNTCSCVLRSECAHEAPIHPEFPWGDKVIYLSCQDYGRFYYMDKKMAVYRQHEGGWSISRQHDSSESLYAAFRFWVVAHMFYTETTKIYIRKQIARSCIDMQRVVYKSNLFMALKSFVQVMRLCPSEYWQHLFNTTHNVVLRKIAAWLLKFM